MFIYFCLQQVLDSITNSSVLFMSFGTCFSIHLITVRFQHFYPEFQVGNLNDFFLNEVNQNYFVQIVNGVNTSLNRQKQNNRKKCDMNDWTPLNTSKPLQFFSITFKNNFIKKHNKNNKINLVNSILMTVIHNKKVAPYKLQMNFFKKNCHLCILSFHSTQFVLGTFDICICK